jgi:Domain of unknown function (DUF2703)
VVAYTGAEVAINKTPDESLEQAIGLGFLTSPTTRVGGKDLQLDFTESYCPTCGEVSGTATGCRVWLYQKQEYSAPPKVMIVEAALREVSGGPQVDDAKIVRPENALENLRRFLEAKRRKETAGVI